MAKVTPEEYGEKLIRRTKGAVDDYRRGVTRVTQAPGQRAAAKASKAAANYAEAIANGSWQRKVAAVSLPEWQDKAINKGAARIAGGLDAAASKIVEKAGRLLAAVDAAQQKITNMPDGTIEDRVARSAAYQMEMHKSKGKI